MSLKNKMLKTEASTGIDFEFPGSTFVVSLAPVSRARRAEILKKCELQAMPGMAGQKIEYDDEKFNKLYAAEVVKTWRGLDEKTLRKLLPLDPQQDIAPNDLDYSAENAEVLMCESPQFNAWVTAALRDTEALNAALKAQSTKNLQTSSAGSV